MPIAAGSCHRVRNTPAQADLPWRERIKNIRGAFHCSDDFTGKRVILVDDVMTSGASLAECARTLKLHGATEVTALVVARALPKEAAKQRGTNRNSSLRAPAPFRALARLNDS
jgi:predicted amidophosphoribosyltransferase